MKSGCSISPYQNQAKGFSGRFGFTRHSLDQSSRKLCNSSILFIYLRSSIHSIGQPSERGQQCMLKTDQTNSISLLSSGTISFAVGMQDRHQTLCSILLPPSIILVPGLGVLGLSLNLLSQGHHQIAKGLSCAPRWLHWGCFIQCGAALACPHRHHSCYAELPAPGMDT